MVRLPILDSRLSYVAALALAIVLASCSLPASEPKSGTASDDIDDLTGVSSRMRKNSVSK